jgi:hypothetical protein
MANYGELLLATAMGERMALNSATADINRIIGQHKNYVFAAKSQIHGFRASLAARRLAEDQLIAALKAENADHPLASREAIEAIAREVVPKTLLDPEVIKKTYPDGVLPKGSVMPPNSILTVA